MMTDQQTAENNKRRDMQYAYTGGFAKRAHSRLIFNDTFNQILTFGVFK